MKNNKKIFVILIVLIVVIFLVIFLINNFSESNQLNKEAGKKEELLFIEETTFEERGDFIKNYVANKFNVSSDLVTALIARESESHINGMFIIADEEDEAVTGYFFGVIDKNINIVWAEEQFPDCSLINQYNFPSEMAPSCF